MPDQDLPQANEEPEAPPRLVEALRRLRQPTLLVPPQIDAAALNRPRLHLARIRQLQGTASESGDYGLALAAHSGEAGARLAGQLLSREQPVPRRRPMAWPTLLWKILALAVLLAALLLLQREWERHRGASPTIRLQHPSAP